LPTHPSIHPTAIVSATASISSDVQIGPYCVVGDASKLEAGVTLISHVVIGERTHLGAGCVAHPFSAVGGPPQDLKYEGESTDLVVGANTVIREHATLHRGTRGGGGVTRVGSRCLIMAGAHVAHDCQVSDGVVMANGASLGGHVEVGEGAVLGAFAGVHQFTRIGTLAMVAAGSMVSLDVAPYCMVQGDRARLLGPNLEGLRRAGWSDSSILEVRRAVRQWLSPGVCLPKAGTEQSHHLKLLSDFVSSSERGVCRFRKPNL